MRGAASRRRASAGLATLALGGAALLAGPGGAGARSPDECTDRLRLRRFTALERWQGPFSNAVRYSKFCELPRSTPVPVTEPMSVGDLPKSFNVAPVPSLAAPSTRGAM